MGRKHNYEDRDELEWNQFEEGLQMNELKLGSVAVAVAIHKTEWELYFSSTTGDLDYKEKSSTT